MNTESVDGLDPMKDETKNIIKRKVKKVMKRTESDGHENFDIQCCFFK